MNDSTTIAAIATPAGMGGVGIIRISGKQAQAIAETITKKTISRPRYAYYADFYDENDNVIDSGIVIRFQAPHSYTGEEVVEFQGHGGVYVIQAVLQRIIACGARQARPGEFTERAFLNGKMDLLQAEAVADLIAARSQTAANAALQSLSGAFSDKIATLQEAVILLRVYVEAALDFSDEEIDFLSDGKVEGDIVALLTQIATIKKQAAFGKLLQNGVNVVLVGQPNAGKSSLLNYLLGQERAIVTEQAGTTRDTLEETLIISGVPVKITDTAGLRETQDAVEKVGVERAKKAVKQADLAIWLRDCQTLSDDKPSELDGVDYLEVHNKIDLAAAENHSITTAPTDTVYRISAKTGEGIEALIQAISDKVHIKQTEESIFSARERHLIALSETESHISTAHTLIKSQQTPELVAEELRLAQQSLSKITGEYHNDDLLGAIFSHFCIGK